MNALKVAGDNTAIYLAAGVYRNHRFGSRATLATLSVATVQNVKNILAYCRGRSEAEEFWGRVGSVASPAWRCAALRLSGPAIPSQL